VSKRARLVRRLVLVLTWGGAVALAVVAIETIGPGRVASDLTGARPGWLALSLVAMIAAMLARAASWQVIVAAALPHRRVNPRDVSAATMIGVLLSAALPGRLGEPARAFVLSRRLGNSRETFPVVVGTIVAQSALNILALIALGAIILTSTRALTGRAALLTSLIVVPLALLALVLIAPRLIPDAGRSRLGRALSVLRRGLLRVRTGLSVFRGPRAGVLAALFQFGAWALQVASVDAISQSLGLGARVGLAASAAVLFAVNVSAAVPVTPSNVGVFQAAVIAVLSAGYGAPTAKSLALGIVLQAVEVATAVLLGVPALLREGLTWSELRTDAAQAAHGVPPEQGTSAPSRTE
jgi:phosphatidyl-myo-inositol alpha-mannosyltransferase